MSNNYDLNRRTFSGKNGRSKCNRFFKNLSLLLRKSSNSFLRDLLWAWATALNDKWSITNGVILRLSETPPDSLDDDASFLESALLALCDIFYFIEKIN